MSDRSEAFPNLPGWGFPLHLPLSVKAQGGGIDGDKVVSLVESERARWVDLFEKRGQVGLDAEAKYLVGRLDQLEALFHERHAEALRLTEFVEPREEFRALMAAATLAPHIDVNLPRRDSGDRTPNEHEQALLDIQDRERESSDFASALRLSLDVLRIVQYRFSVGKGNTRSDWQELYDEFGASAYTELPFHDESPDLSHRKSWKMFGKFIINRFTEHRAKGATIEAAAIAISEDLKRVFEGALKTQGMNADTFGTTQLRRVREAHGRGEL